MFTIPIIGYIENKNTLINIYIHNISFLLKFKKINGAYYRVFIATITLLSFVLRSDLSELLNMKLTVNLHLTTSSLRLF